MYEKKTQYECPSVEDITTDETYAFTINPSCEYQEWDQPLRLERFYDLMKVQLLHFAHSINVTGNIEISKGGRLHFHGYIKFNNVLRFFVDDVHKLQKYCTYCIKKIDDEEEWHKYVTKQTLIPDKYRTISTPDKELKIADNIKIVPKVAHKKFR